jgi:hypothetical protein
MPKEPYADGNVSPSRAHERFLCQQAVTTPRLRGRSPQKSSGPREYALRMPHEVVPISASDANARERAETQSP